MAPPKRKREGKTTARPSFKYINLPLDLWKRLKAYADGQEDRSVSWAAKKAIREFLDRVESEPSGSGE
jgi:hypothetical protein